MKNALKSQFLLKFLLKISSSLKVLRNLLETLLSNSTNLLEQLEKMTPV